MLPALGNAPTCDPAGRSGLYAAYLAALAERGAGNTAFRSAARSFLARWPDPADWACEPLPVRLSAGSGTRPFLNFLMLAGFLQPGYDYLLERKLSALLRESKYHPIGAQLDRFLTGAAELGYSAGPSKGMAAQVAVRLLIQTGRTLGALTPADFAEFEAAIGAAGDPSRQGFQALPGCVVRVPRGDLPPGQPRRTGGQTVHPAGLELGAAPDGGAAAAAGIAGRLPGMRRGDPRPIHRVAHGISARSFRPAADRHRPGADHAGRAGSATTHRALPGRGRRGPAPAHRCAAVGVGTAQPDPHRRPDDRRHQRVGVAAGTRPAAGLPPRRPPVAAPVAPLPARRTPTGG